MLLQLLQPSRMQMASGGSYIALWWEFFHGGDILDVYVPPREYVRSFQPPVDTFPTWTNSLPSLNYKLLVTYWILPLTFHLRSSSPRRVLKNIFLQEYSDVSNLPHNIDRLLFAKDFEYAYCSFRPEHLFVDFFYLKLTTFIYSAIFFVLVPLNGFQLDDGRQNYVIFFKEHTFWFKLCPFMFNNTLVYFINTFRQEKFTNANNAWRSSCRMIPTSRQATYCTAS